MNDQRVTETIPFVIVLELVTLICSEEGTIPPREADPGRMLF